MLLHVGVGDYIVLRKEARHDLFRRNIIQNPKSTVKFYIFVTLSSSITMHGRYQKFPITIQGVLHKHIKDHDKWHILAFIVSIDAMVTFPTTLACMKMQPPLWVYVVRSCDSCVCEISSTSFRKKCRFLFTPIIPTPDWKVYLVCNYYAT